MADLTDSHLSAARNLLVRECERARTESWALAAAAVYPRVSARLSPVIGTVGVRALFARCLKLNRVAFPAFAALDLPPESGEEDAQLARRLEAALETMDAEHALEAATALYATLFALLNTFIGEQLTWQIVRTTFEDDVGTESEEAE